MKSVVIVRKVMIVNKYNKKEETVRIFLNEIIHPNFCKVQVKVFHEKTITLAGRQNNQCDYLLANKAGKYIGVIEAKDRGKLKQKSVAQCILQFLSLQKSKQRCCCIFGILTDACKFGFFFRL